MPDWLTILLALGGSAIINLLVSYFGKRNLDKSYEAKDRAKEEGEEAIRLIQEQKLHNDIVDNIKGIFAPIELKINNIQNQLKDTNSKIDATMSGTLSTLRNDILTCYYRCREKGYRNDYDYTNIHDLYDAYKELHGNSFVSDVMQRFDNLPNKEDVKDSNRRLNE